MNAILKTGIIATAASTVMAGCYIFHKSIADFVKDKISEHCNDKIKEKNLKEAYHG